MYICIYIYIYIYIYMYTDMNVLCITLTSPLPRTSLGNSYSLKDMGRCSFRSELCKQKYFSNAVLCKSTKCVDSIIWPGSPALIEVPVGC